MRSEQAETMPNAKGSQIWTIVGWLAFAVPLGIYMLLQLAAGHNLGVVFGA